MIKIYIKSLKSINSGQFVGLGNKLTFLVGPNSAGKSAVFLALQKLDGEDSDFKFDQTIVHTNPNRQGEISSVSALGIEWHENTKNKKSNDCIETYTCHFPAKVTQNITADEIINIHCINKVSEPEEYEDGNIIKSESIFLNGSHRISTYSIDTMGFYYSFALLRNKSLAKKDFTSIFISLENIDKALARKFDEANLWLIEIFKSRPSTTEENPLKEYQLKVHNELRKKLESASQRHQNLLAFNVFFWNKAELTEIIKSSYKDKRRQRMLNICDRFNSIVDRYRNSWVRRAKASYPGKSFAAALVSAERALPTDNQLSATIKYWKESESFQVLMDDALNTSWFKKSPGLFGKQSRLSTLESVNRALTENLFIDNGYLVEIDSKILISKEDLENNEGLDSIELEEQEFNCQVYLRDAHGRRLKFSDVGSGIGYVLPVLIESFRQSNSGKTVFLQQPELHLHPALQANLTDVLIEASVDRRIVAETHSEHLILRALKRVRQTNAGTLADKNLQLTPSDIAVNYFEPLPDGSTRVHILRVSEDGDFIDRWPNGFFSERDKELFDE